MPELLHYIIGTLTSHIILRIVPFHYANNVLNILIKNITYNGKNFRFSSIFFVVEVNGLRLRVNGMNITLGKKYSYYYYVWKYFYRNFH